jgi:hypothetical protein
MSEPGAVKQKDLFPANGIKPADAKKIRETLLTEDDWYKEGATIWIRPSGIQRLVIAEEEPKLAQVFVELQVLRKAQNRRYVLCRKRGVSERVACMIPNRLKAEQLVGKKIRAEERTDPDGSKHYRHEYLARF